MADDEEAVVLACTSLVFCALSVHVNKTEKRRHAVWVKNYLEKRDFWMRQFSSDVRFNESQSDLVKIQSKVPETPGMGKPKGKP